MSEQSTPFSPDATMLLSSHCAHCPGVLDSLAKMVKNGELGNLQVINLELHPEAMQEYKVRSVPWVKIGNHELSGAQTIEALQQRAQWARDEQLQQGNLLADFDSLLSEGKVAKVVEAIKQDQTSMQAIMTLLGDPGTVLSTRIGIGVVFEEFSNTELIKTLVPDLGELTKHTDQRIRADAYHYLGMTDDKSAIPLLEMGKKDSDKEVREIATDSLNILKHA